MKFFKIYDIIADGKHSLRGMIYVISIVVVEDELKTQKLIKNVLRKTLISNDDNVNISYFTKYTEDLKKIIDDNTIRKIFIMDIELEGTISGIDIAKMIREEDWESEIIFITCHDKMFETVFRNVYEVFAFIEKFHDMEKRLEDDLNLIFKKNFDNKMLRISNRNADLQIYYRSITHILRDKEERKVQIFTDNNSFKVNMNLIDVFELLDERFIQTHRSCITNRFRVNEWNWTNGYMMLDNGKKVEYLSKKYKKEVEKVC